MPGFHCDGCLAALLLVFSFGYDSARGFTIANLRKPNHSSYVQKRRIRNTQLYHSHEFWRKERSSDEIESFVNSCLENFPSEPASPLNNYEATGIPRVEVISAEPPLILIRDFLSSSMCSEIIRTAIQTGKMEESTCGEDQEVSRLRTSSTAWLSDEECTTPSRLIADKVASISGLPTCYMENLQVVRYLPGQEFTLHTDHQSSFNSLKKRGRLATCLLYLAEPLSGGETWFPGVDDLEDVDHSDGFVNGSTTVDPSTGSAVFFWNTVEKPGSVGYNPAMDLEVDIKMRHAGLPVLQGAKWVCNRWIHPVDYGAGVRGVVAPKQQLI